MKTLKLNSVSAKELKKFSNVPETSEALLDAVDKHRLVIAWETPKNEDDAPRLWLGFLASVTFNGYAPKYEVHPVSTLTNFNNPLSFDNIAVVDYLKCPKVFFNNGTVQTAGYLVGAEPTLAEDDWMCNVRVAPFHTDERYHKALASDCVEVGDIKLGIATVEE